MLINYTLFVISIIFFLYGFFPINIIDTSNRINLPSSIKDVNFEVNKLHYAEYEKLVIIIIDALRYDFINSTYTPFMWNKSSLNGCLSKLQVEAPTVTLPRIKALISGNVPQFVDVVLNLIRNEQISDSILHQAVLNNKSIVFYGDDTWLKLCPQVFKRSEGTSSFYVNDYTEVDRNVTRNVEVEMKNFDWDVMILHYLGLDHIGHTSGPFSSLIPGKLKEMDNVVKYIHDELQKLGELKKSLILITGDHGMKDSGGHGGSTYSETHVPLVTIGTTCISSNFAQIDIAPTLASLLGIEIPSTSIGAVATNLLSSLSSERLLFILRYNLLHLRNKLDLCDEFNNITDAHYLFMKNYTRDIEVLKKSYETCTNRIASTLKNKSTSQDINVLTFSFLAMVNCFLSFYNMKQKFTNTNFIFVSCIILQFVVNFFIFNCLVFILQISFISYQIISLIKIVSKQESKLNFHSFLILLTILQPIFFISSSFIEEEHQIWYYYGTSISVLIICCNLKLQKHSCDVILLVIAFRFLKKLNQTGDKWASLPDIAFYLKKEEHVFYLMTFFMFSLILLYLFCIFISEFKKLNLLFITLIVTSICFFHAYDKNILIGKIIWILLFLNFVINFNYKTILLTWLLIAALLLRPYNNILLSFTIYSSYVIHKHVKNQNSKEILHVWLGNTLFFCQGHSNGLSSIDIASGYVGLTEYDPVLVMFQVLCHSYTFPVLTYILSSQKSIHKNYFLLHRALAMCIITFIVLLQRQHLFVWSVFAPKLLIESSNFITFYIIIIVQSLFIECKNKFHYYKTKKKKCIY